MEPFNLIANTTIALPWQVCAGTYSKRFGLQDLHIERLISSLEAEAFHADPRSSEVSYIAELPLLAERDFLRKEFSSPLLLSTLQNLRNNGLRATVSAYLLRGRHVGGTEPPYFEAELRDYSDDTSNPPFSRRAMGSGSNGLSGITCSLRLCGDPAKLSDFISPFFKVLETVYLPQRMSL